MFKGSFTALITPFKNGQVDDQAFTRLVEWQIEEGTHGLVPVGTTGECPTLSHDEHKHVVELCIKTARKRVPVIAGAGSNSTAEAIDFTRHAKKAGADAVLHVTGYYNKPTQEGLYQHFKAINDAVDIPIFLYNVPPRTDRRHLGGDHGPLRQAEERHRRQGRDGQRVARDLAAAGLRQRFRPALGRGCDGSGLQCARRTGLHLRHLQRGSAAVLGVPGSLHEGRLEDGARDPGSAHAAARCAVLRDLRPAL